MDMDARQRADAAFAKKQERAAEASGAWAEYEAEQIALNSNMERLRGERLAREATEGFATKPKKKTKGRRQVRQVVDATAV